MMGLNLGYLLKSFLLFHDSITYCLIHFQHWSPNPIICVTIGALLLSSASAAFLDNLVVANINDLYTSYLLSYTENDFKSLNFSSSILGGKAIVGNALIVAGGKTICIYYT